ncbi:MAG: molybdopterin-binding protein [Candidatus Eremiobacteraeota bacterium]|nr:molybdopterin-binding protein [Candidatus Eremiobacteraeota bacterium]
MKPIGTLISLEEALGICREHTAPVAEKEEISLAGASGRVLAADITAPLPIPSFDRAAMDGYAVRSEDTFGAGEFNAVSLRCLEKIHAGSAPSREIGRGECSQIATGAMVPRGADAVVMVEHTECRGDLILVHKPVYPRQHISPAGEDIKEGQAVLRRGDFLSPAKIGVLAALGALTACVFCRPRVAVIPTGNEVVPPGGPLGKGQIYDINSSTLKALLEAHGAEVILSGHVVEDDAGKLEEAIRAFRDFHIIIIAGGSSVGEKDLLAEAMSRLGKVLFHGIAVKPGKPTLLGKTGATLIFGMPGNPASCLSNAYIMLIPLVRAMAGLPAYEPRKVALPLARRVVSTLGRHQFLTVKTAGGQAEPAFKTSSSITSLALADGYIEIPPLVELLEEGTMVEVTLF